MRFNNNFYERIILSGLAFIAFLPVQNLYAWGKTGHRIVADIAMHFLDKSSQENVQQYLGTTTFEDASIWMDEMRTDQSYDFMKPWHYINIEKGASYNPSNGENIIDRLSITTNELKHKQTLCEAQIKNDILLLFHLIGDLHQPLHVGYGIDRGGNTIRVDFLSTPTNLHSVWDEGIIQHDHISSEDCLKLFPDLSGNGLTGIETMDWIAWLNESRSLLDQVYNFSGQTLDEEYAQKNKIVIEKQLLSAGRRLAFVLENLFSGPGKAQG